MKILNTFILFLYKVYSNKEFRKHNKHNFLKLGNYCKPDIIKAGKKSYGTLNVSEGSKDLFHLFIGNYCSIANNVQFLLSNEHSYKTISTYPMKMNLLNLGREACGKGDIILYDDVWIGFGAIICSGVTINQGTVIGAGSVVTKDTPPYSIVCGNPAKVIKYRFPQELIKRLLKIDITKILDCVNIEDIDLYYMNLNSFVLDNLIDISNKK